MVLKLGKIYFTHLIKNSGSMSDVDAWYEKVSDTEVRETLKNLMNGRISDSIWFINDTILANRLKTATIVNELPPKINLVD